MNASPNVTTRDDRDETGKQRRPPADLVDHRIQLGLHRQFIEGAERERLLLLGVRLSGQGINHGAKPA